jgi:hypothetical protein
VEKFDLLARRGEMPVVYENEQVTIYRIAQ